MIGKVKKLEGLYVLDITKPSSSTDAHINTVSISFQTWHNRLGHLSSKCLDKLKDKLHCNVSKFSINSPCFICPLAKQRNLSFTAHNNMSSSLFDLIHCDI